jgi:formate hydrogenlyase subunit 3/multisubunit Na+/H+ antiporter MnhD subunit
MLASMVALMFVGSTLMFDPNGTCENEPNHHMPKSNTFGLAYQGERFLLFLLLISCCAASNLQNFIGLLAILWSILLLVYGYGDTRYVAKKFAACHFLALIFCACADILSKNMGRHTGATVLHILGFGLLVPIYPLSSWIDSFFSRAPSLFLSTWLVIIRPVIVSFFLSTPGLLVSTGENTSINFLLYIMVYGTLGFVPILFFTKTRLRTLAAYMTCWQSGYIWLFTMRLPTVKFDTVMLLAITQGIFMAIIAQVTTALYKRAKTDSLKNLEGLFETNYFAAIFMMSAMVFLTITPLIFIYKKNMPPLPHAFVYQILASMALPIIFNLKIYKLMAKSSPKPDKISS